MCSDGPNQCSEDNHFKVETEATFAIRSYLLFHFKFPYEHAMYRTADEMHALLMPAAVAPGQAGRNSSGGIHDNTDPAMRHATTVLPHNARALSHAAQQLVRRRTVLPASSALWR